MKKNILILLAFSSVTFAMETTDNPIRKETFSATAPNILSSIQNDLEKILNLANDTQEEGLLSSMRKICTQPASNFFSNTEVLQISNELFLLQKKLDKEDSNVHDPEGFLFEAFAQYIENKKKVTIDISGFKKPKKSFTMEDIAQNFSSLAMSNVDLEQDITKDLSALLAVYIYNYEQKDQDPFRVGKKIGQDIIEGIKDLLTSKKN